ncbi:hypothetical protein [Chitinimonas lacunae]|uniref:DUF1795 domain-containing protein n=1 Tax=Chitinimonas lacunae TaxID=1963018 RepID=A0ABV8MRZ8_9NEIS
MRYFAASLALSGALALSVAAQAEPLAPKSLQRLAWNLDGASWEVDKDGASDKGQPEVSVFHKNAGIMVSLQENNSAATVDAHWQEYVKATRAVSRVFNEVSVPSELKPPAGFSCRAEESSLGDDPPNKTRVLCGAVQGKTLALLSLTLPKEEWRPHLQDLNAMLKGISWRN